MHSVAPAQSAGLSRRTLLRTVVVGLVALGFVRPGSALAASGRGAMTLAPGPWLTIATDGTVRLLVPKVEMGQGVHGLLRTLVAEELDLDPVAIGVENCLSDPRFGNLITGGSTSTAGQWQPFRRAGAVARAMLVAAAADRWGVSPADCRTRDGRVLSADGRSAPYADLVAAAAELPVPADDAVRLKPPADFTVIGRADIPDPHHAAIVTGAARYGADVRLPGMLFASIERAPVLGARLAHVDDTAARRVPGVVDVVPLAGNAWPSLDHVRAGVAVLATGSWAAMKGRAALRLGWTGGLTQVDTDRQRAEMLALLDRPGLTVRADGDPAGAAGQGPVVTATYTSPHLAHAALEPPNATAWVRDGRMQVWTGSHRQRRLHDAIVRELGFRTEDVTVHTPLLGGSFGRRLEVDYGLEAAMLATATGRPVQVLWTRADDLALGPYRPSSVHRLTASLDGRGRISSLSHRAVGDSVFLQQSPEFLEADGSDWSLTLPMSLLGYDIPTVAMDHHPYRSDVPCCWWRGTASTQVQVVHECFMDELAAAAGRDPLDFRLAHMPAGTVLELAPVTFDRKTAVSMDLMRRVLTAAAERAGWGRSAPGVHRGIACGFYRCPATYTAAVAEVGPGPDGVPRVRRLTVVTDCGLGVNPTTVARQLEGNAIFALAALRQRITVTDGQVRQRGFEAFPLPAMADVPPIDAVLLPSDRPPSGVGEPATPVVLAAILNALAAAGGRPIRDLPLDA